MDIQKLTQKSQEALAAAQSSAMALGHQQVDVEHVLLAMVEQPEGLLPRVFQKMGVDLQSVKERLKESLAKIPSVSGPGTEAGKVYLTPRLGKVFAQAESEAKRLKDEYISVEHFALAVLELEKSTPLGKLLSKVGVEKNSFLSALTAIRGNQRVVSANPEGT
ncbi:MAG: hypothetical protein KDD64_16685, partial [Bdellovibrionales bacterium]|nr:hypothetical protein [Bdellovibrionales bacterium]